MNWALALFILIVVVTQVALFFVNIAVMTFGWGLMPVSWTWIVGGWLVSVVILVGSLILGSRRK